MKTAITTILGIVALAFVSASAHAQYLPPGDVRIAYAFQTDDLTTSSQTFTDLLSRTLVVPAGYIGDMLALIDTTTAGDNTVFRIVVNGTEIPAGLGNSARLPAGRHTLKLQYAYDPDGGGAASVGSVGMCSMSVVVNIRKK